MMVMWKIVPGSRFGSVPKSYECSLSEGYLLFWVILFNVQKRSIYLFMLEKWKTFIVDPWSLSHSRSPSLHWIRYQVSCIMDKLSNIWRQAKLSLSTKLRLHSTFVVSVMILYGCEIWTLLHSGERRLEAFHIVLPAMTLLHPSSSRTSSSPYCFTSGCRHRNWS